MKTILLNTFIILCTASFNIACHKAGPTENDNSGLSRKDYIFTIDTLSFVETGQTYLKSIWGSSTSDVWAVGQNSNGYENIYHYNGVKWSAITAFPPMEYGMNFQCVTGFGPNDIYIVGLKDYWFPRPNGGIYYSDSGLIVHYNGASWQVMDTPSGSDGLLKIWGSDPSNIWAGGYDGTLLHYDGAMWQKQPFDTVQIITSIFGFGTQQLYCITADDGSKTGIYDTAKYYFREYSQGQWEIKDRLLFTNPLYAYGFGHMGMWGTSPDNLYSIGSNIYKRIGNSWQFVIGMYYLYNDIHGTANNNIFAVGDHGAIEHYNGKDWTGINDYAQTIVSFIGIMPFDKEVFILANYNLQSYVIHGKLK